MKRLHVHVSVADLQHSIRFYSTLFGTDPTVEKGDYAKWMLDDPRVNFAISQRGRKTGVDHLGMQAEDTAELELVGERLKAADAVGLAEKDTTCCYARSDKYWTEDPQGVRWENFLTHGESTTYSAAHHDVPLAACCGTEEKGAAAPGAAEAGAGQAEASCCKPEEAGKAGCCETEASKRGEACCDPKAAGKSGCCG